MTPRGYPSGQVDRRADPDGADITDGQFSCHADHPVCKKSVDHSAVQQGGEYSAMYASGIALIEARGVPYRYGFTCGTKVELES